MLWFGYRTAELRRLRGGDGRGRSWPSVFVAEYNRDPKRVQPWRTDWQSDGERLPSEISISPATQKQVTVRRGHRTEDYDIVDGARELVRDLVAIRS